MNSERYPKFYRLLAHPFTLEVLEDVKKVFEIGSTETGQPFSTSQISEAFSRREFAYYYNVFIYLSNLVRTVERMEQVPIYLRRFPNSKYFAEHNITLPTWMSYHYANFVIMNVSLYDIALLLTNEVFVLGNEPRFCNEKTVARHKRVKDTRVKQALDRLAQAVEEYRDPRNLFVHRGHLPPLGFVDDLEMFDVLQKTEEELGMKVSVNNPIMEMFSSPTILQDLYRMERRTLVKQLEQRIDLLVELLLGLFDAEKPVYESVSEQLTQLT